MLEAWFCVVCAAKCRKLRRSMRATKSTGLLLWLEVLMEPECHPHQALLMHEEAAQQDFNP